MDASAEGAGTFFLGMLADPATNTLWTCQLTPVPDVTPGSVIPRCEGSISPPAPETSLEPAG